MLIVKIEDKYQSRILEAKEVRAKKRSNGGIYALALLELTSGKYEFDRWLIIRPVLYTEVFVQAPNGEYYLEYSLPEGGKGNSFVYEELDKLIVVKKDETITCDLCNEVIAVPKADLTPTTVKFDSNFKIIAALSCKESVDRGYHAKVLSIAKHSLFVTQERFVEEYL